MDKKLLSPTIVLVALCASMFFATRGVRAQGGLSTGSIRGTVTDNSGAMVPEAKVTVRSDSTGITSTTTTAMDGAYVVVNLNVGSYTVTVEKTGFKTSVQNNVIVYIAQSTTTDFQLLVGSTTQSVEVTAEAPIVNTETADRATTLSRQVAMDLPLQVSGGMRDIQSFMFVSPGVTGDTFSAKVNGGPNMTYEVYIDGLPYLDSDHQGTISDTQTTPYDSMDQFTLMTQTYDAQAGIGTAILNMHFKSGTNGLHGGVFEYVRNNILDARGFFNNQTPSVEKQDEYGFTVGGPVYIPKLYDGRNKTFFNLTWDKFWQYGSAATALITDPTQAMTQGDFSHYTDRSGNLIPIFDPSTTAPDGHGGYMRNQFSCNGALNVICPAQFSAISTTLLPAVPVSTLPGSFNNRITNIVGQPTKIPHWVGKLDHNIGSKVALHVSEYYFFVDVVQTVNNNPGFMGAYRTIVAPVYFSRMSLDLTPKPNLQNTIGVENEAGAGCFNPYPVNSTINTKVTPTGFPVPGMTISGIESFGHTDDTEIQRCVAGDPNWAVVDTLNWLKGRHSVKAGMEIRTLDENYVYGINAYLGQFAFSNLTTSQPNSPNYGSEGSGFASWLLGDLNSYTKTAFPEKHLLQSRWHFWYLQDNFRMKPKLTLNLGFRWGWYSPTTEKYGRMSSFDPSVPNPGADGLLGSLVYDDKQGGPCIGSGGASLCRHAFANTDFHDFEPRIGFAYRQNAKTVFRGGYGISSIPGGAVLDMGPELGTGYVDGFIASQTTQSPDNGVTPAFQWDSANAPPPSVSPVRDRTYDNNSSTMTIGPDQARVTYMQNWSLTVERELPGHNALEVSYVGDKGTRLGAYMENLNQVNDKWLSLGNDLNQPVTCLANDTCPNAIAAGVQIPFSSFPTTNSIAQALRPYPQYLFIDSRMQQTGASTYHALQMRFQKTFANGLSYLVSYTLSKTISNTNSQFTTFNAGPLDTYNRKLEKAIDVADLPNVVRVSGLYALPMGPDKAHLNYHGVAGKVLGGWEVGWFLTYQAGSPIGVGGGNPLPIFNGQTRPNALTGVAEKAFTGGKFDPATSLYLNAAAWTPNAPLTFGTAGPYQPSLRTFPYYNESISVIKRTTIHESVNFELRAEFFNAFNRTEFGGPNATIGPAFGQIGGQENSPRVIQIGARLNF